MNDGVYKLLRQATDNSGRPLIDSERDDERLLGKPVYISPSLATAFTSLGITGCTVFGDLGSVKVRLSRPQIRRSVEVGQADITRGEALYIARARADCVYFDPSAGAKPPAALFIVN